MKSSLGTQLRHLVELLDGAVATAYADAGLKYRPRYTPVMRFLMQNESSTIGLIAQQTGISQPAATQTIALMIKDGLVRAKSNSTDGRQKMIELTAKGRDLIPDLVLCWAATAAAAASLEAELPFSLSLLLDSTINALSLKSYDVRIKEARLSKSMSLAAAATPEK